MTSLFLICGLVIATICAIVFSTPRFGDFFNKYVDNQSKTHEPRSVQEMIPAREATSTLTRPGGTSRSILAFVGVLFIFTLGGVTMLGIIRSHQPEIIILTPYNGATVDIQATIKGTSPFADRKNYVVITDIPNNVSYVQPGPLAVGSEGHWQTSVQFGEAPHCGVEFFVRAFATHQNVNPGQLPDLPTDAIFSGTVNVKRKACS